MPDGISKALGEVEQRLAEQNEAWRGVRRAVEAVDEGALIAAAGSVLEEFQRVCEDPGCSHVVMPGLVRA